LGQTLIYLIVLPFGSLIIAITVIRAMRSFRYVSELRARGSAWTVPFTQPKPSDRFHEQVWIPLCEGVSKAAAEKLRRPLTPKERQSIWRSRTPLALEVAIKEIESAHTPEEVSVLLAGIPSGMDRPDPSGWCRGDPA
jgi:hypothetical protein